MKFDDNEGGESNNMENEETKKEKIVKPWSKASKKTK